MIQGNTLIGVKNGVKLQKEIEFLKGKMKEHFKFFSNHSPELKKRKKGGSHSPPIKQGSQSRQSKVGRSKAKMNENVIFATADNRMNMN